MPINPDVDSEATKRNPMRKMAKTIALKAIIPHLNERIKDITPNQCYEGIMKNESIWGVAPIALKGEALTWLRRFAFLYNRFEKDITSDLLLECWLKIDRPDLYEIVVGVKINGEDTGLVWFASQVESFKKQFRENLK